MSEKMGIKNLTSRVGERLIPGPIFDKDSHLHYLKHLFPYEYFKSHLKTCAEVLEVGCGEGYGTFTLAQAVPHIMGIDVEPEVISHARGKYVRENCQFGTYDGNRFPFADGHFDAVVTFQVIEHIVDDQSFVQEVRRVLKPGGLFIVTTPNREWRLRPGQKPWNRFHIREYDASGLKDVLKTAFENVEIQGIRAIPEIQAYEHGKVRRSFQRYDFFNLRHVVPDKTKKNLKKLVRYLVESPRTMKAADQSWREFGLKDYYLVSQDIESEALDLVGICT